MAEAISFAEFTCWNQEDFRYARKPVVFRLYSVGRWLGQKVDVEFQSDYGVWYHQDNDFLIHQLSVAAPHVEWGVLIYHRKWDHSGIDICEPDEDKLVARMEVRQYRGRRLDVLERDLGSNVVRLDDYRTSKLNELAVHPDVEKLFADG